MAFLRAMMNATTGSTRRTARGKSGLTPALRPGRHTTSTSAKQWRAEWYSGPAGSRAFFLHVPPGLARDAEVPLVLALHGCDQTAEDFAEATRWNALADRYGFVVAYPQQTAAHHAQRCWNWFRARHQQRGQGEPAILAGILAQIRQHHRGWHIDSSRVYVVGLSAGGAMALILAATYPERFAGVGVHSAPPYASATSTVSALRAMAARTPPAPSLNSPLPPLIVFQGTADNLVNADNATRVADQWLAARPGEELRHRQVRMPASLLRTATSRRSAEIRRWYAPDGRRKLEVWSVDGLGHAWSGGTAKGSYSDPRGPRASTEMWRFLSGQHLDGSADTAQRTTTNPGSEMS